MTTTPKNLLAVRTFLLDHLNIKPAKTSADLESDEVGIVGDPKHRGGYHCGRDRLDADDYSVRESSRDRNGLTLDAAALDVGQFSIRVKGKAHDLRSFNVWLVAQCKAGKPDTKDIREVIYSLDGRTVKRWDRLGKRTTGDSSHLWHTHISYFRDSVKAGRDQTPLFRRYLTEIGVLAAPTPPAQPAPPAPKWKDRDMFLLRKVNDNTMYLCRDGYRVALLDPRLQLDPLRKAGVPELQVHTDAELDLLGGPERKSAAS